MTRTGLLIVVAAAILVGIVFAVWPQLDLAISRLFADPRPLPFMLSYDPSLTLLRQAAMWVVALFMLPTLIALGSKLLRPRRPLLVRGRAIVLLVTTMALVPGLFANVVFKDHWGRPRPVHVTEFGGPLPFMPWWDPRGACPNNCSFVSGDASGAFWTLAPAALAPPQWRALAYGAAVLFGSAVGALRISFGGHFFTDVFFAGVLAYMTIWIVHGLIFRWRTRLSDAGIDAALTTALLAPGRWLRRIVKGRSP